MKAARKLLFAGFLCRSGGHVYETLSWLNFHNEIITAPHSFPDIIRQLTCVTVHQESLDVKAACRELVGSLCTLVGKEKKKFKEKIKKEKRKI